MLKLLSCIMAGAAFAAGTGCGHHFDRSTLPGAYALRPSANARVLSGAELGNDPSRSVLDAIRQAMPEVRVRRSDGACPHVELRGPDSLRGEGNPVVYVDGTRLTDTCTLASLPASEARRVEVYPIGFTQRPGYTGDGHGLILIFLKRASDAAADAR
ncbi:MAG TPA: TonB-dependent receptor plug domain-containing protein [Longimicrobiales bacterium]